MTSMLNPAAGTLPAPRCPKCAAEMAAYERSGVVVDQCRECRGIYLDRGELERLIDAEAAFGTGAPSRHAVAPAHPASAPVPDWMLLPPPGGRACRHRRAHHTWGGVADPVLDPVKGAPGAGAAPSTPPG